MIRSISTILVLALAGNVALADTKLDADARLAFERGETLYKEGRYAEARAEFAAGYELSHRPLFLFNMAECSRLDHEPALARTQYERYMSEAPTGELVSLARQRLAALPAPPAVIVVRGATDEPRSRVVPLALGAGAMAAVGGAIGFELWGDSIYDRAKREPDPTTQDSLWHSANRRRYLAEGLGLAGVGCASVAAWWYLRGERRTVIAPAVGTDRATLSVIGAF
jgi:hypothetical protein